MVSPRCDKNDDKEPGSCLPRELHSRARTGAVSRGLCMTKSSQRAAGTLDSRRSPATMRATPHDDAEFAGEGALGSIALRAVGLVAAVVAGAAGAAAQEPPERFPSRFVTIVAPFPPGGPSDTTARLLAGPMSKALGQQIVIENVSGAGGTIGSSRVAKAQPDGYQLVISGSGTHAAVEYLYK